MFVYNADSICGIFERAVKEKGNKKSSATTEQRLSLWVRTKTVLKFMKQAKKFEVFRKKKKFKSFFVLMQNEYKGRTAKFIKNGKVYYAQFAKEVWHNVNQRQIVANFEMT